MHTDGAANDTGDRPPSRSISEKTEILAPTPVTAPPGPPVTEASPPVTAAPPPLTEAASPATAAPPPLTEAAPPATAAPPPLTEAQRPPGTEGPPPPVRADQVQDEFREGRPGPLRRLTLYVSGVDRRVLRYAPMEESEFVVQGTLVILTAIVAAVSGLAAASYLTAATFTINPVTIAVGLAWGLLIFFFDRALVSGTLNPYHFRSTDIASLRAGGESWTHVLELSEPAPRARLGEFIRVGLVASIRVALAFATSLIAAEMVLFLIFQPEVNARADYLVKTEKEGRINQVQQQYAALVQQRQAQRERFLGKDDPEVQRLTTQLPQDNQLLDQARTDLGVLSAAAAAELDGDPYTGTLSNGTIVTTTGDRGEGAAAQSLRQRRDAQAALVNDLTKRRDDTTAALESRRQSLATASGEGMNRLSQQDLDAAETLRRDIAAIEAGDNRGLLVRRAALQSLTHDLRPDTVEPDPVPPCTGPLAWFCAIRNWLVPPTPMGPDIVALRVIFFVVEILPITVKVIASLRRRRPYDIAKAALEHTSKVEAVRMLDRHVHDAALEISARRELRSELGGQPAPPPRPRQVSDRSTSVRAR